jgi:hypothetical protein
MDAQWNFSSGAVEIRKIRTFPLCDFIEFASGRLWNNTLAGARTEIVTQIWRR